MDRFINRFIIAYSSQLFVIGGAIGYFDKNNKKLNRYKRIIYYGAWTTIGGLGVLGNNINLFKN